MTSIPIVEHGRARPSPGDRARVERVAQTLRSEHPDIERPRSFLPLACRGIDEAAPTLHLDDFGELAMVGRYHDVSFLQQRARLRAGDGDLVASAVAPDPDYETYCRESLGLGEVRWLVPRSPRDPLRLATACWTDREVRRDLVQAARSAGAMEVHPHLGNFSTWATSLLLHQRSRRPVQVVAAPPGLARFVNHKLHFADAVRRLFEEELLPRTYPAPNLAILTRRVQDLARDARLLAIKVPDAVGGAGNLVLRARRFAGRRTGEIRAELKELVSDFGWHGEYSLVVSKWETEVLVAPSAQLWVPPESQGEPVVEGIYRQRIVGDQGFFGGGRPAFLPSDLEQEIVDRSWQLALLFQRLGYVGRCSFDLLLTGSDLPSARIEFVECNGRWGGTSLPMTLMNRLFGDWAQQPHAFREYRFPGLERLGFGELCRRMEPELWDRRKRSGSFILFNPGRLPVVSGIDAIALGQTWEEAEAGAADILPQRLRQVAAAASD